MQSTFWIWEATSVKNPCERAFPLETTAHRISALAAMVWALIFSSRDLPSETDRHHHVPTIAEICYARVDEILAKRRDKITINRVESATTNQRD